MERLSMTEQAKKKIADWIELQVQDSDSIDPTAIAAKGVIELGNDPQLQDEIFRTTLHLYIRDTVTNKISSYRSDVIRVGDVYESRRTFAERVAKSKFTKWFERVGERDYRPVLDMDRTLLQTAAGFYRESAGIATLHAQKLEALARRCKKGLTLRESLTEDEITKVLAEVEQAKEEA